MRTPAARRLSIWLLNAAKPASCTVAAATPPDRSMMLTLPSWCAPAEVMEEGILVSRFMLADHSVAALLLSLEGLRCVAELREREERQKEEAREREREREREAAAAAERAVAEGTAVG